MRAVLFALVVAGGWRRRGGVVALLRRPVVAGRAGDPDLAIPLDRVGDDGLA